jgi:alpha-L-rhamnosidase
MGLLEPDDWHGKWIGSDAPPGSPAPMLRREFEIKRRVRQARVHISGIGYYELRLNGKKVGDRVLEPAFTNYDKRVLYSTYDVTGQLSDGKNAIGVTLGTGWYDCHIKAVWNFHEASWRDRPKLLMELRIEFDDGSIDTINSDESWTQSTGPTVFDSIYSGENYDARLEKGDDAIAWRPVKIMKAPKGKLVSQQMPPIRIIDTLKPAKITEPKPGVFIFDFAQNFAGVPQLHVTGAAGTTVAMRCGERLAADGTLDNANIEQHVAKFGNKQFQEDHYTLRGGNADEVWQPRFTYHGFQYVQVTGFPGKPTLESLRGVVEHTDFESVGEFECSNELLNRIFRAGRWSYLNNAHGYPTDCPTREKNGWMGDAHLAIEQGLLNFDGITFYE